MEKLKTKEEVLTEIVQICKSYKCKKILLTGSIKTIDKFKLLIASQVNIIGNLSFDYLESKTNYEDELNVLDNADILNLKNLYYTLTLENSLRDRILQLLKGENTEYARKALNDTISFLDYNSTVN